MIKMYDAKDVHDDDDKDVHDKDVHDDDDKDVWWW